MPIFDWLIPSAFDQDIISSSCDQKLRTSDLKIWS
jgi:hypothetical protein